MLLRNPNEDHWTGPICLDGDHDHLLDPDHRALSNPKAFFDRVRKITGPMASIQVSTVNSLLNLGAHWSTGWMAYGLATAWWEARLKPCEEIGHGRNHPYGKLGKYRQAQYGRGLVQLTWDRNYEWADRVCWKIGLTKPGDILANFDLVLRPDIAANILIKGMEMGAFCPPHSLAHEIHTEEGTKQEFLNARRIINGTDRRETIAEFAIQFVECLHDGGWE